MEQKKKLFCIILTGPIIQKHNDFSEVQYTVTLNLLWLWHRRRGIVQSLKKQNNLPALQAKQFLWIPRQPVAVLK